MEKRQIKIDDILNGQTVNFEIPLGDDFSTRLNQSEISNGDYIEDIKNKNINKNINYEKYLFYPAYLNKEIHFFDDGSFINNDGLVEVNDEGEPASYSVDLDAYSCDVLKIKFNLYLKHRECDENNDYGSWDSSDEYYWNRWDGTKNGNRKAIDNKKSTKTSGDLLGCLGFTDEDVFYQKNNFKKSFLRISVYDSPYKQAQSLLYYATLFFDSNASYKKYVNMNNYQKQDNSELRVYQTEYINNEGNVVEIPDENKLTATFTCTSKNDDTACSDGFYLYLFNTIVNRGGCTKLYMKVEFNNAKYGKTVVLTNPREKEWFVDVEVDGNITHHNVSLSEANEIKDEILESNPSADVQFTMVNSVGKQIPLSSSLFPEDYEVTKGSNGNSYVDIMKFYEDLYIPIFVRYNNKKNRYEWYIASNEQKDLMNSNIIPKPEPDVININLYEPRINKLKTK